MRVDDIAGQFGITFGSPFSGVAFYSEVLALDVAKATQLLEKSAVIRSTVHAYFADFGRRGNKSDPLHLRRLLRSGREWPSSRGAKRRDEIAPSHLTRPRRCPTNCPNYTNLERPARHKWHLPVRTLAKSMSEMGQTLQGIHRQTGPEVRFGPKADLISMLIPGGSCFSP